MPNAKGGKGYKKGKNGSEQEEKMIEWNVDDGQMIGYFITFVMNHLHYQTTMFGKVDVYFVHHDHRKNGVGLTLFKYHEDEMRRLGVKKLMNVCKLHKDHTPLFESLGYKKFEVVFAKLL